VIVYSSDEVKVAFRDDVPPPLFVAINPSFDPARISAALRRLAAQLEQGESLPGPLHASSDSAPPMVAYIGEPLAALEDEVRS